MHIALVAGEASGDILGAALIRSIRAREPAARFSGVAGPLMIEAGCEAVAGIEELSVMGLVEVLRHLPRLLRLRRKLTRHYIDGRPDVFIGIDAPDFNLGLERRLRTAGIRTVHWVSPSVWAWRQGRIHSVKESVDLMLCLLPFEQDIYKRHGVPVAFTGHPLADELVPEASTGPARQALGIPAGGPVIALLPGSRRGEMKYLAVPFAQAAARLATANPALRFVVPIAKPSLRATFEAAVREHAPHADILMVDGQSRLAMQAADVVLLASGTATLECLLLKRPMVVAYRTAALTAFLLLKLGLLKVRYVSLPNLLTAAPRVAELLQGQATPERMAAEITVLLDNPAARAAQLEQFDAVRAALGGGAADRAAVAVLGLPRQAGHA